ncbi:anhydro-N-acetylmuramic acid kinase [Hyphomicrobiales bacterium 4NK60-0047b]|jgi:anhydro-N-acetylmuramic acid kinase
MKLVSKVAIGLMSGTSCDGVDAALIETDGERIFSKGPYCFVPYEISEQDMLKSAMRKVASVCDHDQRLEIASSVEGLVREKHRFAVEELLKKAGRRADQIDVVGFHGQTLFHEPDASFTLQVGDGEKLSTELEIPVVYDFRSKDMEYGGQGAPMVPVYHHALVHSLVSEGKLSLPVAVVNIGGVANVTYVGGAGNETGLIANNRQCLPDMLAFDTGPGNALVNDWVEAHTGELMDEGGRYAASGIADDKIIRTFLNEAYFKSLPPKSLDRDQFKVPNLEHLSLEDGAATLTEITAQTIAMSKAFMDATPKHWIIVGGGAYNKELMRRLSCAVARDLTVSENLGWQSEAMEAEAFGFLAVRHLSDLPFSYPRTTGVSKPVSGGVLSGETGLI